MAATHALIVVDVQNDFCEGGSLAVDGGSAVAAAVTAHLQAERDRYDLVIGSLDDHLPDSTNSGHIALPPEQPDYVDTWPAHCIQGTWGALPHPALDTSLIDLWVKKGQGVPAYSAFEATDDRQRLLAEVLRERGIERVTVVGLATDYCVRATCRDARGAQLPTVLDLDLTAAVHPKDVQRVAAELTGSGVVIAGADDRTG